MEKESKKNHQLDDINNEQNGVYIGENFYRIPEDITYDELIGWYGEEYLRGYGILPNVEEE